MAHGPCGDEFKAAFSCFVYSNEEPKGMDCVDRFQYEKTTYLSRGEEGEPQKKWSAHTANTRIQ